MANMFAQFQHGHATCCFNMTMLRGAKGQCFVICALVININGLLKSNNAMSLSDSTNAAVHASATALLLLLLLRVLLLTVSPKNGAHIRKDATMASTQATSGFAPTAAPHAT